MKLIAFGFLMVVSTSILAQNPTLVQALWTGDKPISGPNESGQERTVVAIAIPGNRSIPVVKPDSTDSLITKRALLTSAIYRNGKKLSNAAVLEAVQSISKSRTQFRWGTIVKPVGPLVSLAGVAIGYIAIKGTQATAIVRGKGSAANPNPPDVQVEYTKRSVPKLLAGLGLFVGGMCLVELSNELIAKSANGYNVQLGQPRKVSFLYKLKLGITPDGNVGLYARF